MYKVGEKIGKYTVTRNFSTANAGQCEWGFVSDDGTEYFIKRFFNPIYPGKDAPGGEKSIEKKRKRCQEFEAKHKAIQEALSHLGAGGSIVKTVDFLKYGKNPNESEHYFKVCYKVNTESVTDDIHKLPTAERLFVMLTAAFTIRVLHSQNIIHFDIKPDNILIQKFGENTIAKLIDFDDSIIYGNPFTPDDIVADMTYYSPELALYINTGGETEVPDFKSDVFSLGLVFSEYWTGQIPRFSSDYTYASETVLNYEKLQISNSRIKKNIILSSGLKPEEEVNQLIEQMLDLSPAKRPTSQEVHKKLQEILVKIKI